MARNSKDGGTRGRDAMANPTNRVWIELEKPRDKAHADQICALANNMLHRLNGAPAESKFWWSEHEASYCYGGNFGYTVQTDRGVWLNLDYLGRPLESPAAA